MSNMNLSTLGAHWRRTPRHIQFALELTVAAFIAVAGSWLAAKAGGKLNAKSNADVRASFAQLRIAEALERAYPAPPSCVALATTTFATYCAEYSDGSRGLPPPSLLRRDPYQWRSMDGMVNTVSNIRIIEKPAPDPDPEPCRAALSRLQPERCGL